MTLIINRRAHLINSFHETIPSPSQLTLIERLRFLPRETDTMAEHNYTFNVTMSCGGCSGAVERVLKKLEGQ